MLLLAWSDLRLESVKLLWFYTSCVGRFSKIEKDKPGMNIEQKVILQLLIFFKSAVEFRTIYLL